MEIRLEGISKRYTAEWILKNFSYTFNQGKNYALTGPNGSGKSTLLLIIAGWITPTEGNINCLNGEERIDPKLIYRQIGVAAPYLELVEDLTLAEMVDFHIRFHKLNHGLTREDFLREIFLDREKNKYLRHFSSGMKQRLKLGLAMFSNAPVLLLDEPTSNLDERARGWYLQTLDSVKKNKLVIMASNQPEEFESCEEQINILNFKGIRV